MTPLTVSTRRTIRTVRGKYKSATVIVLRRGHVVVRFESHLYLMTDGEIADRVARLVSDETEPSGRTS